MKTVEAILVSLVANLLFAITWEQPGAPLVMLAVLVVGIALIVHDRVRRGH